MRAAVVALLVALVGVAGPRATVADEQALADVQWGWVTLELGGATALAVATHSSGRGDRLAVAGALGSVAAAITAGVVADGTRAPLAGANAVHGALIVGAEAALIGAIIDGDHQGPRLRSRAIAAGLVGAAAGAWIGATRIPDDAYSLPWTYAPLGGFAAGVVIAAGAELLALELAERNKVRVGLVESALLLQGHGVLLLRLLDFGGVHLVVLHGWLGRNGCRWARNTRLKWPRWPMGGLRTGGVYEQRQHPR